MVHPVCSRFYTRSIFIASLLLVLTLCSFAQSTPKPIAASSSTIRSPKTIAGIRVEDVHQVRVSPDGARVAIRHPYIIIDIEKGVMREMKDRYIDMSTDLLYSYGAGANLPDTRPGKPAGSTAYGIKVAGVFSDTLTRTVFPRFTSILAVDGGTRRMLTVGARSNGTTTGLYYADLKTGDSTQTLRSDRFGSDGFPAIMRTNYLVYTGYYTFLIVPLDTSKVISMNKDGALRTDLADENYIYLHPREDNNRLWAYDRRTGKKMADQQFPTATKNQMRYSMFNNRIYRYDQTSNMVYEQEVRDTNFITLSSYQLGSFTLPKNQRWEMVACKGPSLLFVPYSIDSAEVYGGATNAATLISLSTGKPTLTISPFFVRTSAILAQQQADKKAADERWKQALAQENQQKKEEADKKAADCKAAWGNNAYRRGITRMYTVAGDRHYVILESYDCATDTYKMWEPGKDALATRLFGNSLTLSGDRLRFISELADKQYHTCTGCDGDGTYEVTTYTTKTKELPWGYFSGIETKSTRTTATTRNQFCNKCNGKGVVLR